MFETENQFRKLWNLPRLAASEGYRSEDGHQSSRPGASEVPGKDGGRPRWAHLKISNTHPSKPLMTQPPPLRHALNSFIMNRSIYVSPFGFHKYVAVYGGNCMVCPVFLCIYSCVFSLERFCLSACRDSVLQSQHWPGAKVQSSSFSLSVNNGYVPVEVYWLFSRVFFGNHQAV